MAKGASKVGNGFEQAFSPTVDYQKTGDVDHNTRYVSDKLNQDWNEFTKDYQVGVTDADNQAIAGQYDPKTKEWTGYISSPNSYKINKALYENDGKSDEQIFNSRDLNTVKTLDRLIDNHVTPKDGSYTRYCTIASIKSTYGLTDAQANILQNAGSLDKTGLNMLNQAMKGTISSSKSYTSVSANRSANAFGDISNNRSKGYIIERSISVPKGVKSFAPKQQAQESEVIFGRGMRTKLTKVTISKDGHIVLHERFDGYEN